MHALHEDEWADLGKLLEEDQNLDHMIEDLRRHQVTQVKRGNMLNARYGVKNANLVKCDFQALPFDEATFDAAYAIEAGCHSPDYLAFCKQV